MTTHLPSQDEQPSNAMKTMADSETVVVPSQPSPVVLPKQEEQEEESFYFEEEQPDLAAAFVTPFQLSGTMPPLDTQAAQSADQVSPVLPRPATSPVKKTSRRPHFSLTMVAIIICVVVIVGMLVLNALAQTTPPLLQTQKASTTQSAGRPQPKPTMKPVTAPAKKNGTNGNNGQGQTQQSSSDWVPQQLPNGWTNAGLFSADALQALRTAVSFNDREMSLDYRSVGTRNNHGGTFTAATFIMTAAAKQRFVQNDVREINNTLFDTVENTKLVRVVINPQPQLVKFAQQGQQQFAWVTVAFQFWQSKVDPNNPQHRIEGKEIDPATNQPLLRHMTVLLLHVPQQNAGNNPAMGGTGWLVSTYSFDPVGALPTIIQPA